MEGWARKHPWGRPLQTPIRAWPGATWQVCRTRPEDLDPDVLADMITARIAPDAAIQDASPRRVGTRRLFDRGKYRVRFSGPGCLLMKKMVQLAVVTGDQTVSAPDAGSK